MAIYKGINSKIENAPVKHPSQLNAFFTGSVDHFSGTVVTQNSKTYSYKYYLNGKNQKVTYKGKFDFSTTAKFKQSTINSYHHYIQNKLNSYLIGINYTFAEFLIYPTVKYANKVMKKFFKKNDKLIGGKAKDKLWGYAGNDKISGSSGNDILCGGLGKDKLIGGKGKDIFKLSKGKGYDLIEDFKNKQDKIFIGSMKNLKLKNKGKDVFIYSGKDLLAKVKKAKGLLSKTGQYLV